MCKQHIPITVYDNGGTQQYCKECGKPISKWKPNKKKEDKEDGRRISTQQLQIHVQDI